ncbi:MAG: Bax inhibitor-1 family protein [Candidatus Obscuribacterales bacterium]|nr:Bax inhibitor-1 family protein [Candidatus Obscuribacterales bacterium]
MIETTLMTKVFLLLAGCLSCGGLGAYVGRNIRSLGTMIGLALAMLVGVFVVWYASGVSPLVGIVSLAGWTFISGLFSGPSLRHYRERLGWETVAWVFFSSAGVMLGLGMFGAYSGIDFTFLGGILFFALSVLLLVGLVMLFVRLGRQAAIAESIASMIVFSGYFIYDFFRVTRVTNTWEHAVQATMSIYLDFINFFFDALRLLELLSNK